MDLFMITFHSPNSQWTYVYRKYSCLIFCSFQKEIKTLIISHSGADEMVCREVAGKGIYHKPHNNLSSISENPMLEEH